MRFLGRLIFDSFKVDLKFKYCMSGEIKLLNES